jgi:hypothetical protein
MPINVQCPAAADNSACPTFSSEEGQVSSCQTVFTAESLAARCRTACQWAEEEPARAQFDLPRDEGSPLG